MVTKHIFTKVAQKISMTRPILHSNEEFICKRVLIEDLIDIFKANNPRFDEDKFIAACQTKKNAYSA